MPSFSPHISLTVPETILQALAAVLGGFAAVLKPSPPVFRLYRGSQTSRQRPPTLAKLLLDFTTSIPRSTCPEPKVSHLSQLQHPLPTFSTVLPPPATVIKFSPPSFKLSLALSKLSPAVSTLPPPPLNLALVFFFDFTDSSRLVGMPSPRQHLLHFYGWARRSWRSHKDILGGSSWLDYDRAYDV